MSLRDWIKKLEQHGGMIKVRCNECGQTWWIRELAVFEFMAWSWSKDVADGEHRSLPAPDVYQLLTHPHDDALVEDRTGLPLAHELLEAWGEGKT